MLTERYGRREDDSEDAEFTGRCSTVTRREQHNSRRFEFGWWDWSQRREVREFFILNFFHFCQDLVGRAFGLWQGALAGRVMANKSSIR